MPATLDAAFILRLFLLADEGQRFLPIAAQRGTYRRCNLSLEERIRRFCSTPRAEFVFDAQVIRWPHFISYSVKRCATTMFHDDADGLCFESGCSAPLRPQSPPQIRYQWPPRDARIYATLRQGMLAAAVAKIGRRCCAGADLKMMPRRRQFDAAGAI